MSKGGQVDAGWNGRGIWRRIPEPLVTLLRLPHASPRAHPVSPITRHSSRLTPHASLLTFLAFVLPGFAGDVIEWKTNYYTVTGASLSELHQSIRQARPWKEKSPHHATTEWRIDWQFTVSREAGACRCDRFTTRATITLTLPLWNPPAQTHESVRQAWRSYYAALLEHEQGHAQTALEAVAELRRSVDGFGTRTDCEALKSGLNALAGRVIDRHRQRDRDYDQRTRHGATQGAVLPGRFRRDR